MAKVGAKRAAELTGKSKSTIQRAMNSGKISFEKDNNNRRVIDVSELERAFGLVEAETQSQTSSAQDELKRASELLEMERLRMKLKTLEDQLSAKEDQLEDMRAQRDQWQKQAQQVLLTSQYSQRQAEEYKAEIRERNKREQAKRQKLMKERMGRLKSQEESAKKAGTIKQKTASANESKEQERGGDQASESASSLQPEQSSFWANFKKRISA